MKIMTAALALTSIAFAGGAFAEGWTHASPGLDQFEGSFNAVDDAWGVDYSCSPGFSSLGFRAKGIHVAAGESTITVDGVELAKGNTTYNSKWDATSFSQKVEAEWGDQLKDSHNALIMALARGTEAIWTTPSGDSFSIDLTGSADIKYCEMQ
jgi:hypothetical protein